MDVLDLLDMTEEEQTVECEKYGRQFTESLADLAFRMRDEVCDGFGLRYNWNIALKEVWNKSCTQHQKACYISANGWWIEKSKPIHWIVAAIKAKELAGK